MSAKGEGPRVRGSTSASDGSGRPPGARLNCDLSEVAA